MNKVKLFIWGARNNGLPCAVGFPKLNSFQQVRFSLISWGIWHHCNTIIRIAVAKFDELPLNFVVGLHFEFIKANCKTERIMGQCSDHMWLPSTGNDLKINIDATVCEARW